LQFTEKKKEEKLCYNILNSLDEFLKTIFFNLTFREMREHCKCSRTYESVVCIIILFTTNISTINVD